MISVENIEVWGFEHAIRGMRNPFNSWNHSDSKDCNEYGEDCDFCEHNYSSCSKYYIGPNDLTLMRKLFKAGTEHRKYLRQIFVSMDITAPLYWWKEFDTYKVGTVANSCSTMHKLTAKPFEMSDFSNNKLGVESYAVLQALIGVLNKYRKEYLDSKEKFFWWQMIQLLPSSYNQKRTVTMSYENVFSIIRQRSGHKLDEWNEFVATLKKLPYVSEIGDFNEQESS